jgi:hypothetical protein
MNSSINALNSQFQSLDALPQDVAKAMTVEVFRPSGMTIPVLNQTGEGLVACIRAGAKATIVKITRNEGLSWDEVRDDMSPDQCWGLSCLFQQDTAQTIATVFSWDFWFKYRSAIIKDLGERNSQNIVRLIFSCVAGDILYWRMSGQVYLDAMENETNEVKVLCLAKKAQIAFSHAEMTKNLLKSVCPCDVSITVV